jgi:outer membrane protein assembly factor BamB
MTSRAAPLWAVLAAVSLLAACASGPAKPKPADLVALTPVVVAKPLWSAKLPAISFALQVQVHGDKLTLAASDGTVLQLDAASGRELWRQAVGSPLSAGVGSDGQLSAVVTQANELVALQEGRVLWRQRLTTQAYTAPLVAGARVFVLSADRAVSAYDGRTGARLWTQQRPGNDPLVLRQAGVILPVGDTLVAGLSGRLLGLNPLNGSVRWDAAIATPAASTRSSAWWTWSAPLPAKAMWCARVPSRRPWAASTPKRATPLGRASLTVWWAWRPTSAKSLAPSPTAPCRPGAAAMASAAGPATGCVFAS